MVQSLVFGAWQMPCMNTCSGTGFNLIPVMSAHLHYMASGSCPDQL